MLGKSDDHLFLSALIALGLILFGFFVLANTGLLQLALSSDRSMISWLILALYALATAHWLYRAKVLDKETAICATAPPIALPSFSEARTKLLRRSPKRTSGSACGHSRRPPTATRHHR